MEKKKKGSGKVLIAIGAVLVALAVAVVSVGMYFEGVLNTYVGMGEAKVVAKPGSENWDSEYYKADKPTADEVDVIAKDVTKRIAEEGITLMKNNGVLPLAGNESVSLFGRRSVDTVWGGTGSGAGDAGQCTPIAEAFTAQGFKVNDTLTKLYADNLDKVPTGYNAMDKLPALTFYIGEFPMSYYTGAVTGSYASYKDAAFVVIGRSGGEGMDLSTDLKGAIASEELAAMTADHPETANYADGQHSLELTYEEKELLKHVEDNFDKVIVIVNSGTLWEEYFSDYKKNDVPSGGDYSYVCVAGNAATCVYEENYAAGESPELLINKTGGSFSATIPLDNIEGDLTLTFKVNNPLTVSTTTKNVTLSGNTTAAKGDNTVTITGVTASMTALNITFSNSTSSNVRIDNIVLSYSNTIRTEKVVVTAAEYATYYSAANALDFSGTGITVYTATDNETSVSLNEVTSGKVPAGTAVVLYKEGADGTPVNVPVATSAAAVEGTNDLHVVGEGGLTGEDNIYVLAKKNGKVGFYLWDKTATLNEGKIYLQGKATYGAREFLGFDDNGTTSINEELGMKNDEFANAPVFNLNGQRVSQPTKGLYIVDGRKVVIR